MHFYFSELLSSSINQGNFKQGKDQLDLNKNWKNCLGDQREDKFKILHFAK
jgi:hypothetical protein